MSKRQKTLRVLFWVLCFAIALVSWRFMIWGVELTMPPMVYHALERELAFYLHVGLAPVALAVMPFQFLPNLRAKRPAVHRWIGRLYGAAILLSGLGGLVMALGTTAGPVAGVGFGLLAVIWLFSTGWAIWLARQRNIDAHRRWMIRSAALTFAAVTLRLYLPFLAMGFGFETGYSMVAWLCWVPNLIVAEWLFQPKRQRLQRALG